MASKATRARAAARPQAPAKRPVKAPAAGRVQARDASTRTFDPGQAAWLAVVPTVLVVVLAMLVLGPPLGSILFPATPFTFWQSMQSSILPEPTEQARFLIALAAPLLITGLAIRLVQHPPRLRASTAEDITGLIQGAGFLFLLSCFASQRSYSFGSLYTSARTQPHTVYFTVPTLLAATALAAAAFAAVRSPHVRERFAAWTAPTRGRTLAAVLIALGMIAIALLPALNTDASISRVNEAVLYHVQFTFDEAVAVLDGRSPIGNFAAQYGSLWPYVMAGGMTIFGKTLFVFTLLMALVTGAAWLGLFDVLRRLTRSPVTALLLFLPLLATCGYIMRGPGENRYSLVNYFASFPLRYAGPLFVAWLTARHLDGARPRRAWPLFLLGGLAVLNNSDFGVAAVGATLAALLWTGGRPTVASLRQLALQAAVGLAGAIAVVTVLLLVRTGSPPHFALVVRYARMFAVGGFAMLPMRPVIGFSTVIYLTYVAAIGTATVRALRADAGRLLTGMLAWSGIFGLGAAPYYMGRSHPEVLTNMFPAWALAVTLLSIAIVPQLVDRSNRRVLPAVACLLGLGLLTCSLTQTPKPWAELKRIQAHGPRIFERPLGYGFIAAHTRPGERVMILVQLGHRIGQRLGIEDVTPYTGANSIQTLEQMTESIKMLRDEGGKKVFLAQLGTQPEIPLALARAGFRDVTQSGPYGMELWVDTRRAHG